MELSEPVGALPAGAGAPEQVPGHVAPGQALARGARLHQHVHEVPGGAVSPRRVRVRLEGRRQGQEGRSVPGVEVRGDGGVISGLIRDGDPAPAPVRAKMLDHDAVDPGHARGPHEPAEQPDLVPAVVVGAQ